MENEGGSNLNGTEKAPSNKKHTGLLQLLPAAVLACIAALSFRQSVGFWMMFPIYPLCVAVAALFPGKRWHRGAFFLVLTAALNLMEQESLSAALFIIGAAFAYFVFVELAVWCFRRKKLFPCAIGAVLAVGCICANALLFGDPFSAFSAQKKINAYIEQTYNAETGGHVFGNIRFDTSSRLYTMTAYNQKYPINTGELFLCGDYVVDHYRDVLEAQEMQIPAETLTGVLREAFPKGSFTVIRLGISDFPSQETVYSIYDETDYSGRVSYCVQLGETPTYARLLDNARKYMDAISFSGVPYERLIFTGGKGLRYRISLTPVGQNGLFFDGFETGMYTLDHPENHTYLARNGLLECIDRVVRS